MQNLTLLIPGLIFLLGGLPKNKVPRYPSLELLLAKARQNKYQISSFYIQLCDLFGLQKEGGCDLPLAALSRLVDDTDQPQGIWMRADPVHLSAGRGGLTLIDSSTVSLSQHDAIILAAALEQLFSAEGWEFEIPVANRWYLRLSELPKITTFEIDQVVGRDIQKFMPIGPDKQQWCSLMNEVQMILRASEFNQQRENNSKFSINSLWFWGIGQLPDIRPRLWSQLYGNDPVAQGLARLSETSHSSLPNSATEILQIADNSRRVLAVITDIYRASRYQDFSAWQSQLDAMEETWFTLLVDALRNGDLDELIIIADGLKFQFTKYSIFKFWRKQKSLIHYCK